MWIPSLAIALLLVVPACTVRAGPPVEPPAAQRSSAGAGDRDGSRALFARAPGFDADGAMAIVRLLATTIGPREATSDAYARAAATVRARLRALGYRVGTPRLPVPAGTSWGVPVRAGTTLNVVARPAGFDPSAPWVVVGAHLDTVPQAPGANDNASGVAIMLELARLAARRDLPTQVVFVAFGAEEPRGGGDDGHHFGSRAFVARLSEAERATLKGAVSLDRVGIGDTVRVCTGGRGPRTLARVALAQAQRLGIDAVRCTNRTSDHWSFEREGFAGVRLLGDDDPAYHTARDRPRVVERGQLKRIGTLAWETLLRL